MQIIGRHINKTETAQLINKSKADVFDGANIEASVNLWTEGKCRKIQSFGDIMPLALQCELFSQADVLKADGSLNSNSTFP